MKNALGITCNPTSQVVCAFLGRGRGRDKCAQQLEKLNLKETLSLKTHDSGSKDVQTDEMNFMEVTTKLNLPVSAEADVPLHRFCAAGWLVRKPLKQKAVDELKQLFADAMPESAGYVYFLTSKCEKKSKGSAFTKDLRTRTDMEDVGALGADDMLKEWCQFEKSP